MPISGSIKLNSANFQVIENNDGIVEGIKVQMNILINAEISGFKIEKYYSQITHTLPQNEFVSLMQHLGSPENKTSGTDEGGKL